MAEQPSPPPVKVVLSGYYGFGNLGDEALLAAALAGLRRRVPGIRPVVLSGHPRRTAAEHGVEAVARLHPLAVVRALRGARLLLSGGGSLLQDVTGPLSLPYYLGVMELALRMGVPVMVLAQGIGPLRRSLSRRWVGRVLSRVKAITVRDAGSRALLEQLGIPGSRVEVTADLALCLDGEGGTGKAPGGGEPYLVANVRRRELDARRAQALGQALGRTARALGWRLVFLPMHPPEDVPAARAVAVHAARCGAEVRVVEGPLSLAQARAWLAGAEAVVAMRLHALIFAALADRPLLGLSYDPKVDAFLAQLGLEPVATLSRLPEAELLAQRLQAELARREALRRQVRATLPALRRAAERNFDVILQLLGYAPARVTS